MKKLTFIAILFLFVTNAFGQKYLTKNGNIRFFSSAPLENIEAVNNQVSSVLNMENGQMAFTLLMKAFSFEKALMQEHFNEKYVESDKFPKSTFKGSIQNFESLKITEKNQDVTVNGELTIHGITKAVSIPGKLRMEPNGNITGFSKFTVKLSDYQIKIPSAVKDNISETIEVTVDLNYEKVN